MLGITSQTSAFMRDRGIYRSNSLMGAALTTRRNPVLGGGNAYGSNSKNTEFTRTIANVRKEDRVKAAQDDRAMAVERLLTHKNNRETNDLLKEMVAKLDKIEGNGSGLTKMLEGGLLAKLLGGGFKFGAKGGAAGKLFKDAAGRWRNAEGKFVKAPPKGFFNRQAENIANSRVGKGFAKVATTVAESRVGRAAGRVAGVVGKVATPVMRLAGKALNNPVGNFLVSHALTGAKFGGRLLGKAALPITAAMALYDGVNGIRHADEILGRKTNLREKVGVGITKAINGLLFGIPDWISKKIFNRNFSQLIFNGTDDIGKIVNEKISSTIEGAKAFIGRGIGAIGNVFSGAFEAMSSYVKDLTSTGDTLIQAVKRGDAIGAMKALGSLGKLLFKGVVAADVAIVKGGVQAAQAVGGAVSSGAKYVGEKAVNVGSAVASLAKKGVGAVAAMFESRGNAGTVSSGKGDNGGVSYGKYQLASRNGSAAAYIKHSKYASEFAGLRPGTPEFNNKWKEIARRDPQGFEADQHAYIKSTHYDPLAAKIAKDTGLDVSKRGRAVQEAVFSTGVQYGGASSVISKALAGKDPSKMSDAQIISAIQDYKLSTVDTKFRSSSANVRQGVANRIVKEKAILLGLAQNPSDTAKIDVAPTMAQAKAAKPVVTATRQSAKPSNSPRPTAIAATPASVPLTEPLPEPKKVDALGTQRTTPQTSTTTVVDNSTPATKTAPLTGSGSNGRPLVSDVADRPRIDLQAIATTLHAR